MRVLQFGKYYPPHVGGMERVIFDLTHGINRAGIRCDVLCANHAGGDREENEESHTVYRARSFGEFQSMAVAPALLLKLGRLSPAYDIIHFHHPDPISALALFLARPKAKIIVHWHLDIVKQKVAYFFYRPLERWLLRRASRIICTSQTYLESSIPLRGVGDKCVAIPLGIEFPPEVDPAAVRRTRGRWEGRKIVFALGRFTEYKGFQYLIEAGQHLDDTYLIILGGDGTLRNEFTSAINRLNLNDRVVLTGRLSDREVMEHMAACDAFCLPSITRNEAFGIVMLEAMALGKPVIATSIPGSGTSWVNQDRITGVNVEPRNATALAKAIRYLCDDPELSSKLGQQGRQRMMTEFTAARMVSQVIDVYKSCLGIA